MKRECDKREGGVRGRGRGEDGRTGYTNRFYCDCRDGGAGFLVVAGFGFEGAGAGGGVSGELFHVFEALGGC